MLFSALILIIGVLLSPLHSLKAQEIQPAASKKCMDARRPPRL
jgi:hypothetical protein